MVRQERVDLRDELRAQGQLRTEQRDQERPR